MFFVQTPGIRDSWDSFSCHENSAGKMVLGYLSDGIRQRRYFRFAIVQTDRDLLAECTKHIEKDQNGHGSS
jgi:hypothetical protein